jgi:hypothetical protein
MKMGVAVLLHGAVNSLAQGDAGNWGEDTGRHNLLCLLATDPEGGSNHFLP